MTGIVSMNLYSGLRNPAWQLSAADAARFKRLLADLPVVPVPAPHVAAQRAYALPAVQEYAVAAGGADAAATADVPLLEHGVRAAEDDDADVLQRPLSGFRGFVVVFDHGSDGPQRFEIYDRLVIETATGILRQDAGSVTVEEQLYATAPAIIVAQLDGMTFAQLITAGSETPIAGLEGPAHQLACEASPEYQGNTGPWKTHKLDNNCYNYANDKLMILGPAIPGPRNDLGTAANPLNDSSLKRELGTDRLQNLGMKLPSSCPPDDGHYLAIVLRHHPGSGTVKDFHCIRLDRDGTWSHKDGIGRVRNIDDAHRKITDLTTAEFKWTPALVGIYLAFFTKRNLID